MPTALTRCALITLLAGLALPGTGFAQDDEPDAPRILPMPGGPRGVPGPLPSLPAPGAEGDEAPPPGPPPGPPSDEDESDSDDDDAGGSSEDTSSRQKPPVLDPNAKISVDFVDTQLTDVVKYMAEITGRNFILTDELKGDVTIISHQPVSVSEAYEAFLSALEMSGYTTVTVGKATKVVSLGNAAQTPLRVYEGGTIPYTDNFVTQIIQLNNVSVGDISSVVKELAGKSAKVIAYQPTNTLIITDAATNIRRVYKIITGLDVASPTSKLEIIPVVHATADDIAKIIEQVYGSESSSSSSSASSSSTTASDRSSRRRRRARDTDTDSSSSSASESKVGSEGKYIEKIIADERTNSLIVLANEEALIKIKALIAQLDVDVDISSQAQIHVVYLEHAKAEDVSQVLANLSESGSSSSSSTSSSSRTRSQRNLRTPPGAPPLPGDDDSDSGGGAVAAFDSGVRITSDENTNSLVIIATRDQFKVIKDVIEHLDIPRKQVFVQAVVLEIATDDSFDLGLGYHFGTAGDDGSLNILSNQMGASSIGLSTDALTGLAMGVYGAPIDVSVSDGAGGTTTLSVPAFGIALNAIQNNSAVNIVATPEVLTMANEEAKIVVGRNIPFPVSTGRDSNNNPIVSYQREDVATTLKVTPQINESNFVTLEIFQEVSEVEEGSESEEAGFITSKRSAETTVVVKDNQTVVIGGLIGMTETEGESKIPVLGDLPLIGVLFRSTTKQSRKTNLLIVLTPHIINEPADLEEVYRVKWAQRQAFIERFYGKTRDEQEAELKGLLQYSMNYVDEPSPWRTKEVTTPRFDTLGDDDEPTETSATIRLVEDPATVTVESVDTTGPTQDDGIGDPPEDTP